MMPIAHALLDTEEEGIVLRVFSTVRLVHGEYVESYERRFAEAYHVYLASLHLFTPLLL